MTSVSALAARAAVLPLLAACLLPSAAAAAETGQGADPKQQQTATSVDDEPQPEVVTVWGARERQVGRALTSSEGSVDFGRFVDRPLLRVGELAEVVPGLAATQHSGTGKANQYFLRGFNLDHGTDFSISLDGMPLNLRSHAHGQGYLDINFLIPETIERIAYRKGLVHPDAGDFSAAGSASFATFEELPRSFAQVEAGENGWRRFVGAASLGARGWIALERNTDDGPWDRPEALDKTVLTGRVSLGRWSLGGGHYTASWNATDQIPLRAVEAGLISPLGNIDPSVGGSSERTWGNLRYRGGDGLEASAYLMAYSLALFSNFTYLLDDPVNGDAFEQSEERSVAGGAVSRAFAARGPWSARIGGDARFDRIDPVGLYRTAGRARLSTVRQDRIEQDSAGIFGEVSGDFARLRVLAGLRFDAMQVGVSSDTPANSGSQSDSLLSPRVSLAWRFTQTLEGYLGAGRGFHSNDARGATITVDPASGVPADRVPLLVPATGVETGLRFERSRLSATLTLFALELDSELVYVGDAGATEPGDASRRVGAEATVSWAPAPWLTLDGAAAITRARFRRVEAAQDRIPLANEHVLTGGASVRPHPDWVASLTVRHLGPAPLIEDNSVRSDTSTVVNGRIAWSRPRFVIALEALNLTDSDDADITYFYASRLPGEPDGGVEDIHYHPVPPRSLRLQVRALF
jgi:hypothetical protein